MTVATANANDIVRRAFLKIDPAVILEAADSLDLRGGAKISPAVGMPLRTLQQKRDVVAFATTAPIPALRGLLELLAYEILNNVIEALGDNAETPTFEQLAAALSEVETAGASVNDVVALMAFAIAEAFPAAPHCRRLLSDREDLALPELPEGVATPTLLSLKETDPEVKEQRRLRREAEKAKKKAPVARPVKNTKAKVAPAPATRETTPVAPAPSVLVEDRRRTMLTPAEEARFSTDHVLVGTVVIADVPFDAVDSTAPDQKSKDRPALVVAASEEALLVRPIYTNDAEGRALFSPWRRLGMDHASYITENRVALEVTPTETRVRLGQLNVAEWNALF